MNSKKEQKYQYITKQNVKIVSYTCFARQFYLYHDMYEFSRKTAHLHK